MVPVHVFPVVFFTSKLNSLGIPVIIVTIAKS